MKWLFGPLARTFNFSGRSTRKEFWMFTLIFAVIQMILEPIEIALWGAPFICLLMVLVFLVPSLALWVRRLHDMGQSGWWVALAFTVLGAPVPLVMAAFGTQPRANKYGKPPQIRQTNAKASRAPATDAPAAPPINRPSLSPHGALRACSGCGKEFNQDAKFCTSCGSPLR